VVAHFDWFINNYFLLFVLLSANCQLIAQIFFNFPERGCPSKMSFEISSKIFF